MNKPGPTIQPRLVAIVGGSGAGKSWLAGQLPNCLGYHVIPGGERFFMYAQAEAVNIVMAQFLRNV